MVPVWPLAQLGPLAGVEILLIVGLFVGVGLIGTIFWIWMLVEAITKEPKEGDDRLIWVLVVVFTHVIGALIYFIVRRPERIHEHGG